MLISFSPEFDALFPSQAVPKQVADGFTWAEGPVYLPARDEVIFSDVRQNKTWRFRVSDESLHLLESPSHHQNGHCLDAAGRLVACSHGERALLVAIDWQDDKPIWDVLASHWEGKRLNSPNDVCLHPDGSLWFSDPTYGIDKPEEGYGGEMELEGRWVFRIGSGGELSVPIRDRFKPNGLAFASASELWLADTGDGRVYRYEVRGTEAKLTSQSFAVSEYEAETYPRGGKTDGLRLDEQGRIWSSAADGVRVLSPCGQHLLGIIALPEVCANLCFGGSEGNILFMTATNALWKIETNIRGMSFS